MKNVCFAISTGTKTSLISLKELRDYISESDIFKYYFEDSVPCVISSPLREDNNPSFSVFIRHDGCVGWYDFKTAEHGGLFDLLMKVFDIPLSDLITKIHEEVLGGVEIKSLKKIVKSGYLKSYTEKKIKLEVKVRPLRPHDIEYWESYGIPKEKLSFFDIYPISHLFFVKDDESKIVSCDRYAYAYIEFKDNNPTYKIYQPYSEDHKWLNNHDRTVWDFWNKLPKNGENLIICSSRKDAACVWSNTNIPCTSMQAESVKIKESVMSEIKERFTNVFILYDNDWNKSENYGRILGKRIADEHKLIQIEIPEEYKSKDPSDLYLNHGKEVLINVINKLICGTQQMSL